eukprot:TRINITY_DN66105_c13_g1_i2.p1 TRINITY_DN66105_c13_g1~~TRINITY_DN66105_c13_g1_i2.p1  ORF type:complete len:172 (-),score=20.82 TRINITY_DN66105_c13_g1_i2:345-803(-)
MSGKGNDQDKTGVDESLKTLMGQECTVAQEFITKYYKALDHPQRNTPGGMAQVVEFYDGSANLVWNGHGVKHEGTQIQNLLQSLPQTNHDITSIDCQPVAGGDSPKLMLVEVHGIVTYGGDTKFSFDQTMLCALAPTAVKFVYDCYRWTAQQ